MARAKRTIGGVFGGTLGILALSVASGLLVALTTVPFLAVTTTAGNGAIDVFNKLPGDLEIDELMLPTIVYVKDQATGKDVEMTRFYEQNRSPVAYDQIAPVVIDAITSSEDGKFFQHGGVDLLGTVHALLRNATSDDIAGGSTISQQYVKNVLVQRCETTAQTTEEAEECVYDASASEGDSAISRKVQEMRFAIALEQRYSKEQILLGYLNIANFGGTTYGIDAAARYYFGVPASKLNLTQASALAGMLQNPNAFALDVPESESNGAANGYAATKERQLTVLYNMRKDGKISEEQYQAAVEAPIEPKITPSQKGCAAATDMQYFCQMVRGQILNDPAFGAEESDRALLLARGGLKIYTTLDTRLQAAAVATMREQVPASIPEGQLGAAGISIEASTGRVLAVSQNTSYSELAADEGKPGVSSLVFAADKRYGQSMGGGFPSGSTFKLFTLLDWLDKGNSVNQVLDGRNRANFKLLCDGVPVNTGADIQRIGNAGGAPGGPGTPVQFTTSSLNTGFFAMAEKLNVCEIGELAFKLGVVDGQTLEPVKTEGAFSLLGSEPNSPLAIGGAYATVANNGKYCEPKLIDNVTDADGTPRPDLVPETKCTQVLKPEVAATAANTMAGVLTYGTGAGANPYDGTPVFGKTGTHQTYQTWMVESSSTVTNVAWVGNYENDAIDMLDQYIAHSDSGAPYLRYALARSLQANANLYYPGSDFPASDPELTKKVMIEIPKVTGLSIADATKKLEEAGFTVKVGAAVNSTEAKDIIVSQSPEPGKVDTTFEVTIVPSNGIPPAPVAPPKIPMPNVVGQNLADATTQVTTAGFTTVVPECTVNPAAPANGIVTSTDPAANTEVTNDTTITIRYDQATCV